MHLGTSQAASKSVQQVLHVQMVQTEVMCMSLITIWVIYSKIFFHLQISSSTVDSLASTSMTMTTTSHRVPLQSPHLHHGHPSGVPDRADRGDISVGLRPRFNLHCLLQGLQLWSWGRVWLRGLRRTRLHLGLFASLVSVLQQHVFTACDRWIHYLGQVESRVGETEWVGWWFCDDP